jgi:hypothetical protein
MITPIQTMIISCHILGGDAIFQKLLAERRHLLITDELVALYPAIHGAPRTCVSSCSIIASSVGRRCHPSPHEGRAQRALMQRRRAATPVATEERPAVSVGLSKFLLASLHRGEQARASTFGRGVHRPT